MPGWSFIVKMIPDLPVKTAFSPNCCQDNNGGVADHSHQKNQFWRFIDPIYTPKRHSNQQGDGENPSSHSFDSYSTYLLAPRTEFAGQISDELPFLFNRSSRACRLVILHSWVLD